MKRVVSIIIAISLLLSVVASVSAASTSQYVDFNSKKWWSDAITWGLNEAVINGYQETNNSGQVVWRLKADNTIRESEFLAMILRRVAQSDIDNANANSWWAAPFYEVAINYGLPTKSTVTAKNADANGNITRGRTARIVAKIATGELMTERDAVLWLYSQGLSEGKTPGVRTYESYDPNGTLTRAEAVTFIKRLYEAGITQIEEAVPAGEIPEVISID